MGRWRYTPTAKQNPIDTGWGVKHSRTAPASPAGSLNPNGVNQDNEPTSNARLRAQNGDYIDLWVYEIASDFRMNGSRAQSAGHRDFYPRNFVQPSFMVRGQAPSNYQYNELAEFIRSTHLRAINYLGDKYTPPAITFELDGSPTYRLPKRNAHDDIVQVVTRTAEGKRNLRGSHLPMTLRGLVPKFGRGARRFEFAKDWEFEFVVTRSVDWLFNDQRYKARQLQSWSDQITKGALDSYAQRGKTGYTHDENLLQQLAEDLDYQAGLGLGALGYRKSAGAGPD